jgi:predicted flap endonuclease-1-like 5' DNA nuclease
MNLYGGTEMDNNIQKFYVIKNMVRRVQTRTQRAACPGRTRFKQFIGGRRLLRNQKMKLTDDQFKAAHKEIMDGIKCGALELTDPAGWTFFVGTDGVVYQRKGDKVERLIEIKSNTESINKDYFPKVESAITEKVTHKNISSTKEIKSDSLTELPGIGAGRARKLEAANIKTFKQVAEMTPAQLAKVLGAPTTEEQAVEIHKAAFAKIGK